MNSIPDDTVYARLSDDKTTVSEYPVLAINIRNRAHPFDWYAKVAFDTKLEVPAFHTLKENLKVINSTVIASYELVADTLDQVLASLRHKKEETTGEQADVVFEDIDAATIERIKYLSKIKVQALMDEFASSKEYDGIASACSYKDSNIPNFKADAEKCIAFRDNTWMALYFYFDRIASGELTVPKDSAEIMSQLPELVW